LKILAISGSFYPHIGGVALVVQRIGEEIVKRGHEYTVLTVNPGNFASEEFFRGINIIRVKNNPSITYGINVSIWQKLKELIDNYDIIHIHGYHSLLSLESAFICKRMGKPFVFSPHYHGVGHTLCRDFLMKIYKHFGKFSFRWAEKIICVSDYEKNLLLHHFNGLNTKANVIPNGVDQISIPENQSCLRSDDEINLLYVGALRRYKGLEFLLRSLAILKTYDFLAVKLTVIGTGEDKEYFMRLSNTLKVYDSIIWIERVPDDMLIRYYRYADVFVLLSKAEAYGLVVAEALSHGTPCIVANTSALTEYTKEPGCFSIEYPPDPQELSQLIRGIKQSNVQVGPFSEKIQTWMDIGETYEQFYAELIHCYNNRR
jgi:glycosyltransferase involved in cell wall biosynthesis